jgi:four helix bundle protein
MNGERRNAGGRGRRDPRVVRLALDFVGWCHRHRRALERARRTLNEHIQDAADSILLNTGEALDELSRPDKRRFLRYALRSAGEAEKGLRAVAELDLLPAPAVNDGLRLLRDIRLDLRRLIQWTPP